jgi:autotransporter-associated beta strand protein
MGAVEGDILTSYAATYASGLGGEDNAQVTIANSIAGSNGSNDRSGTGAHMRIVGFYESAIDVTNMTTTGGIVGWLSGNNANLADVVTMGGTVGADLVLYICTNTDSSSIAGVTQQPGMYSAINPGSVFTAVVAHEIGGHAWDRDHADGISNPVTIMLHNYCSGGGAAPPYYYTNQYVWFNGVQLFETVANICGQGTGINGGDNSIPLALTAQAVANRRERVVTGPNIGNVIYDWSFNHAAGSAPAGTTIADSVSGALATVRGNGAIFTGSSVRIPGGTTGNVAMSAMSAYIDLPNGILSSNNNISIEIWATPLSAPNYARVFDFGRCAQAGDGLGAAGEYTGAPSDPAPGTTQSYSGITLSDAIGTNISEQLFEAKMTGTAQDCDGALPEVAGLQHHYVVTYTKGTGAFGSSGGGRWNWYQDGDPITYIDVAYPLSAIPDVNDWLGRSEWSADSLANNDYSEVRISNVALTQGQVAANYRLGPNYKPAGNLVTMGASDASGATSFNAAGQWSNASAPASANNYQTYEFTLRTPATGSGGTFGGGSLLLSGGRLYYAGTASSTITVNNLTLNGGAQVYNGGTGTCTLAGSVISTGTGGTLNAENGAFNLTANLSGSGPMTFVNGTTTLAGNNSGFTGPMFVGAGAGGTIIIDSEARLGTNPASFTSNQLDLNRGTVQTTQTMSLSNPNRGIMLDVSAGNFNVTTGTLTLACAITSPNLGSSVIAGALKKAGPGTLLLTTTNSTFNGTLYVDSGSTSANDGIVRVASNVALAGAHSPIFINNDNTGSSTLMLDGSVTNIGLPQAVSLSGRNNSVPAIESLTGTNSIGGLMVNVGGGIYALQCDAGQLSLAGAIDSLATGTRTITFQGNGNFFISGIMSNLDATSFGFTKTGTGSLTINNACVNSGISTLSGGAMYLNSSLNPTLSGTLNTAVGTTFGGAGSTNYTVNIAGVHAPGTVQAPGTETFTGPLSYASTAQLSWSINANSTAGAAISAAGVTISQGAAMNFVFNRSGSAVNFTNSFWTTSHTWTVVSASSISGTFSMGSVSTDSVGNPVSTAGSFKLAQNGTSVTVTFTPSPPEQLWVQSHFGANAGNPAIAGDLADPDGDGFPNIVEYALGTDPNVPSAAAGPRVSILNGRLTITFTRNTGATDVTYNVQGADTITGPWTVLARSTGGAGFTILVSGAAKAETGSGAMVTDQISDAYLITDPAHPRRFLELQVVH